MKKVLSLLLVLVILIGMMPMQVSATEGTQETETVAVVTEPTEAPKVETPASVEDTEAIESSNEEEKAESSELPEPEEEVKAVHEHDYAAVVTAPTCAEHGCTTYTCECGESYVDDYVDPTGEHSYENGVCVNCGTTQALPIVITQQPVPATVTIGEKATVFVEAEGEGLTYQWFYRDSPDGVLSKSTITENTYTLTVKKTNVNRELYCVVTDAYGNQVTTDVVKLLQPLAETLKIIKQPVSDTAIIGEKAAVFVEAQGVDLIYQWYFRNTPGGALSKSSITSNTYTTTVTNNNTQREVYCVITDGHGNQVTTDTVKLLQPLEEELKIITQPKSSNAVVGEKCSISVEVQGVGLTYQWYFRNTPGDALSKSSITANTYTTTVTNNNTQRELYCVITDGHGNSVTTDTIKMIAPGKVYYASIHDALSEHDGRTESTGAAVEVCNESGEQVITLLQNAQLTETIEINSDTTLDLNGYTISSIATTAIIVEAAEVIIRNGDVSLTASGTGTETAPSVAVKVNSGSVLSVYGATITAVDAHDGTVVGILSEKNSELTLTGTEITVSAEKSLYNTCVHAYGIATLIDCTVIAESDYTGNAAGTAYASSSYGISAESDLTLRNCYVWGTHSGVRALGKVFIDGGTYEGYGHGGVYLAGTGTTSYLYNAAFNWAKMRSGTYADTIAGTNNAAFYVGANSNITAYFDGCSFKSNNASKSYCIVLRSSGGEKNNSVYVSNSTFSNYKAYAYRVSNTKNTTNLYAYSGVGNTYSGTGKVFNYSNKGFYTEDSYA